MPRVPESQLNFVWDQQAVKESGDKDHGIKFCVDHDPDAKDGAGEQVLAVAYVPKPREIVYKDQKFGMECTHLVVPGMVVQKIQGRPLSQISFDIKAVAKYMNEYRIAQDGPLNLLFQEEVVDGQGKGFPYVIEVADHNTKLYQAQAQRGRRGSILGKKKGAEVDQEVVMAQRHARRMSVDARKMSTSGSSAADAAAAAAAAHAKSLEDIGETTPTASASRGGRRGSIAGVSSAGSQDGRHTFPPPAAGRRGSIGGRRGSVSAMSMEEAARAAAASVDSGPPRASGRRSSISSVSSRGGRRSSVHSHDSADESAALEAGGTMTGDAHTVSFKSQGEGISGEKLQLQVGRHTVALYAKNGQPHSHYKYGQLSNQSYVKTYDKGFIICLATGRDLVFKAKPKVAAQIAHEVTMGKLTWDELQRQNEESDSSDEVEEPEDAHADLMQVGARIMIGGLVSEAGQKFNGTLGTVLSQNSGRLIVELDNGKKTGIKPINTLPLLNGVKVQLAGLTSDNGSNYNGKLARILNYAASIGRYSVVLETGETIRIKPINAGKVSDDPEVQARLRKMDGRESDDDDESSEDESDEEEEQGNLSWPNEQILQWRRLPCTFSKPGSLGIVWAESEPPGDKFDREMLVVSKVVPNSLAAKETEGLQQYAVLRKVNGVKIGKKAPAKVLGMIEATRVGNEPLQLEFAVPIFEQSTPEQQQGKSETTGLLALKTAPNLMSTSIDEMRDLEEQSIASPRPSGMPSPRPPTPALTSMLAQLGVEHLYDALAQAGCYTLEDLRLLHATPGALKDIGFRPLQLRRLGHTLAGDQQSSSTAATTATPSVAATGAVIPFDLESALASAPAPSSNPEEDHAGGLGPTPATSSKVPRRNIYISPFMTQEDQEAEIVRVKRTMAELQVPGGTLRRVIPGKREWCITPL